MENAKAIVEQMTLEEKAGLLSGRDFWSLKSVQRLDLPGVTVTDGPHGLRRQAGASDHLGLNESVPATCFPAASATGCSFDRDLLAEIGGAMGRECQTEDVAVILGPGANIKRSPLCGRNFEYFSEDPAVTGELAAALISGVEAQGVGTSLKHFAANNQEKSRMTVDAVVDERALREIYLTGFETAVKTGKPQTVMCSYNRLGGVYASENRKLLTDILRTEWGYNGLVMTDWGATNDRVEGVRAGLDLEMPGSGGFNDERVVQAVRSGELDEALVDRCAERVVRLILNYKARHTGAPSDLEAHHALARRAAARSAVLLENRGDVLPLAPGARVAVLGQFAKTPRYQGSGSSKINPTRLDVPLDELEAAGLDTAYAPGYPAEGDAPDGALIDEAVALARERDVTVIFAGLPDPWESEGFDRTHLDMPESHNALIRAVAAVCPRTVVVLMCGAPVTMPWREEVSSILLMYLGGQAVGGAVADLVTGEATPGGRLAETFPLELADVPCNGYFPGTPRTVEYRESIYVGYRWYETTGRPVAYPFGHGLSYTTFALSDLTLDAPALAQGGKVTAEVTVKNTGSRPGSEVVQLYVSGPPDGAVHRPARELRDFFRVDLEPGESRTVTFTLDSRCFAYYNMAVGDWAVEGGTYTVAVGRNSRDMAAQATLRVEGDGLETRLPDYQGAAPIYYNLPSSGPLTVPDEDFAALYGAPLPPAVRDPRAPYDVNCTLAEVEHTLVGRQILSGMTKGMEEALASSGEDIRRMMEASVKEMPLRSLMMMSGGQLTPAQLEGMVDLLNHKWIRGLRKMRRK